MGVKLIAMDLDRTLLNKNAELSPGNSRALKNAVRDGVILVAATGRPWSAVPDCIRENPLFSYVITSNGARTYERAGGTCIRDVLMESSSVDMILQILKDTDYGCEVFLDGIPYGQEDYVRDPVHFGIQPRAENYVKTTRIPVPDIKKFMQEHRKKILGIDFVIADKRERDRVREELIQSGEPVYVTSSTSVRVEISHRDAGKASGMQAICELEKISQKDTAAFGDGENDIDMIRWAGTGVAVANADRLCREAADYVTGAFDKDGLADAFRNRLFIFTDSEKKQHEKFMREALRQAKKAELLDEVPIGCVIVKDNQIIARGYNRRNTDRNTLSHAELNAMKKAARRLGDWRLEGCTMYITLEPCQMCAGALVQSRIDRIVLGSRNPKAGCAGSVINLLQMKQFNHQVEIADGILEKDCGTLLSDFFRHLRVRKRNSTLG